MHPEKSVTLSFIQQQTLTSLLSNIEDARIEGCANIEIDKGQTSGSLWRHRAPVPNIVSLFGDRGTGKTTILVEALRKLQDEQPTRLRILPVFDATQFDQSDSCRFGLLESIRSLSEADGGKHPRTPTCGKEEGYRLASSSFRQLQEKVIASDSLWHQTAAALSVGPTEYARFAGQRARYRLEFARHLSDWLAEHLEKGQLALLPVDDLDLAPGNTIGLVETLIDLQYCRRLVVLVAGDYDEMQRRLIPLLRARHEPEKYSEENAVKTDALKQQAARQIRSTAAQVLVKIFPDKWRSFLQTHHPRARATFPFSEQGHIIPTPVPDESTQMSIGQLLVDLRVCSEASLGYTKWSKVELPAPFIQALLPDRIRRLEMLHHQLAAWHQEVAVNDDFTGKGEAPNPVRTKPNFIGGATLQGLALLLLSHDLHEAAFIFSNLAASHASMESWNVDALVTSHTILAKPLEGSLDVDSPGRLRFELELLTKAVQRGGSTERWLAMAPGSPLLRSNDRGSPVEPSAWLPMFIDLMLTWKPWSRVWFPDRWWLSRQVLSAVRVEVRGTGVMPSNVDELIDTGRTPGRIPTVTLSLLDVWKLLPIRIDYFDTPNFPLAAGWGDLLDLLKVLAEHADRPLTVEIDELRLNQFVGDYLRKERPGLWHEVVQIQRPVADRKPNPFLDEATFLAHVAGVFHLCQLRAEVARRRKKTLGDEGPPLRRTAGRKARPTDDSVMEWFKVTEVVTFDQLASFLIGWLPTGSKEAKPTEWAKATARANDGSLNGVPHELEIEKERR